MSFSTLISADQLRQRLHAGEPTLLLDARFDLNDPALGEGSYRQGHLPGARYVHLERDLCGLKTGRNGRHPLPAFEIWARTAAGWGAVPEKQVVVYDDQGGMFAARLWWMLRQLGLSQVAVLDGGVVAWRATGAELETSVPETWPTSSSAPAGVDRPWPCDVQVHEILLRLRQLYLLDARAPERYRGETEPLDAVAGHIPGARNRFFKNNLDSAGHFFKPAQTLRAEFLAQLGDTPPGEVIHQCGSGVTACHNLLAMEIAGLHASRLYPGSWSEWCSDPQRPIERG